MEIDEKDLRYLRLLAKQYPSIPAAATEIINLTALLNLPKGTEHFVSDIHGEYEAFLHVLRNASGSLKRKIEEHFANTLVEREKRNLSTLIYYPEQKLPLILKSLQADQNEWYRVSFFRLIKLARVVASKYTRTTVREAMPADFAYVMDELLHEQESISNREAYYDAIIEAIISTGRAPAFIIAMAHLIQRLAIAHLHIIGDIYDRGPGAHIIMDTLLDYHSLDFQWGNHDIVWMGAAAGSAACMVNVVRVSLRYANMQTLEDGYGISVLPLATFALDTYRDDPCIQFQPKLSGSEEYTENEIMLLARMQKAIAIIQLKLEGQLIQRRPEYDMADRLLLDKIHLKAGTVCLDGREYPLNDTNFPTLDPAAPYRLSSAEQMVVEKMLLAFANSEKLQQHVRFLYAKGGMYLRHNGNLLYHGCLLMNPDSTFKEVEITGQPLAGRTLLDNVERLARQAYFATDPEMKQVGQDMMWYLWSGADSPLFGKDKMATFERYFIDDKATHYESMDPYYDLRDREGVCRYILEAFDLDPDEGHIINGHVPVKVKKGESPVKAGGKLLVIDGGFAKAYQSKTGIAGYTLIYNSYGFLLASHLPFTSRQKAIEEGLDIHSETQILERTSMRTWVKDTDRGHDIRRRIDELQQLLDAYRAGLIKEST